MTNYYIAGFCSELEKLAVGARWIKQMVAQGLAKRNPVAPSTTKALGRVQGLVQGKTQRLQRDLTKAPSLRQAVNTQKKITGFSQLEPAFTSMKRQFTGSKSLQRASRSASPQVAEGRRLRWADRTYGTDAIDTARQRALSKTPTRRDFRNEGERQMGLLRRKHEAVSSVPGSDTHGLVRDMSRLRKRIGQGG